VLMCMVAQAGLLRVAAVAKLGCQHLMVVLALEVDRAQCP
jgi:hypothetical protein